MNGKAVPVGVSRQGRLFSVCKGTNNGADAIFCLVASSGRPPAPGDPVQTMYLKEETAIIFRILKILPLLLSAAVSAAAATPPSAINLSVETSAADLAAIINRSLPNELYKGEGGAGTAVTVVRNGPVAVTAADNFVHIALPVRLTFGYLSYESYPIRANLRFKAKVDVAPDWRLKTELYYTGLSEELAESIRIGPIKMKPKGMVESVTRPLQSLLAPIIDAKVNDAVRLRGRVEPLWRDAFTPKLISSELGAWLALSPERVVISPMTTANDRVRFSMGVVTGAELTVGPRPQGAAVRPLPPVERLPSFDRSFHLRLAADIFFSDLVAALRPVLLDKSFGEERKITVKGFDLKGEEGRLKVVLTATGDFDGELTVLARPVHNPRENRLTFEDVDFDTRDAGWLVTAGSWLFASTVRGTIKEKLDTAVAEQLEKARIKASTALSSVQLGEHARLSGSVASLSLGEAKVLDDRLTVDVVATGETGIVIR